VHHFYRNEILCSPGLQLAQHVVERRTIAAPNLLKLHTHAQLFEIKWDGFRALLHSDKDGVRLVSRNANTFKTFPALCERLARDLPRRPRRTGMRLH